MENFYNRLIELCVNSPVGGNVGVVWGDKSIVSVVSAHAAKRSAQRNALASLPNMLAHIHSMHKRSMGTCSVYGGAGSKTSTPLAATTTVHPNANTHTRMAC